MQPWWAEDFKKKILIPNIWPPMYKHIDLILYVYLENQTSCQKYVCWIEIFV